MLRDTIHGIFKCFDLDRYEAVRRMLPVNHGTWLDAGCGAGKLFDTCPEFGGWCAGADLSFELLQKARGKNILRRAYLQFNLDSPLPFHGESFDLVSCVSVLQYASRPADFFAEAHRVLKPGGYFIFEVPNFEVFYRRGDQERAKQTGKPLEPQDFWRGVKTHFTWMLTRKLIAEAGFRILRFGTAGIFAGLRNAWPSYLGSEFAYLLQKK